MMVLSSTSTIRSSDFHTCNAAGNAKGFQKSVRRINLRGRFSREVHAQLIPVLTHRQQAATGVEADSLLLVAKLVEQHPGCCESGMTAQIHFNRRRTPAQLIPLLDRHKKSGFRKIILRGDGLQNIIRQPLS